MKKVFLLFSLALVLGLVLVSCPQPNDSGNGGGGNGGSEKPVLPLTMVTLPAGEFLMGSTEKEVTDGLAQDNEGPERSVTLRSFMLGSIEVTEAQWEAVMTTWPGKDPATGDTHPARNINWYDAIEFCNALTRAELTEEDVVYTITKGNETDQNTWIVDIDVTKNGYRLPTEAEWEYAAGGAILTPGTLTTYAGTSEGSELTQYAVFGGGSNPFAVKDKKPVSETYALYDMSGNVWEWCYDWYGGTYYDASANPDNPDNTDNPTGPASSPDSSRVYRGGYWGSDASNVRVAYRNYSTPILRRNSIGFRVARNAN